MKKIPLLLTAVFLMVMGLLFFDASGFSAEIFFQNTNQSCESELVLCASEVVGCGAESHSIACEQRGVAADFSGDNFTDCATARSSAGDEPNITLLINQGSGATSCSSGTGNQFQGPVDVHFDGLDSVNGIGTVVTGQISGTSRTDILAADVVTDQSIAVGADPSSWVDAQDVVTQDFPWWTIVGQTGFDSTQAERTMGLLDCNGDGTFDSVALTALSTGTPHINLHILTNNLATVTAIDVIPGVQGDLTGAATASLAIGNFGGQNGDIAVAMSDPTAGFSSKLVICTNNGSCTFTCGSPTDLTTALSDHGAGQDPAPFSIATGDFNGDSNADLVISEPGLSEGSRGVHYFFGNGAGAFPTDRHVAYNNPPSGSPKVVVTGCFNNDNVQDVAVSYAGIGGGKVGVISSSVAGNGTVTFNSPEDLTFSGGAAVTDVDGIDAANFDAQGGDDLIVLGTSGGNRQAFVFMNSTTLAAAITGNATATAGDSVALTGSCSYGVNTGTNDRFTSTWALTSAAGGTATLSGTSGLAPTFTTDTADTYTVTLTCVSRCTDTSTTTHSIVVSAATPTPTPIPTPAGSINTQGGNIFGCGISSMGKTSTHGLSNIFALLFSLVLLAVLRGGRQRRVFRFFFSALFISSFFMIPSSQAFTPSFSTEFLSPAVDISDYFAVYGSPTLQQRNYHVGFWLDYAHHPYEVGSASSFVRSSGLTDYLLAGHLLGSYGVTDWFNVGARLPVYFWDGIRAPAISRPNENHIGLGDAELDLKLRLLDRKKHKIGLSALPFVTFPTATRASQDFTGNGNFTGGAKLIVDGRPHKRVSVALNAGYEVREGVTEVGGNKVDDHLQLGGAVSVDILKNRLKVIGETQVETTVNDFFARRTTPAEARLGVRYHFKNGLEANAGAGLGYTNGISSPAFRVLAGVTYTRRPFGDYEVPEEKEGEFVSPQEPESEYEVGDELKLADKIYFEFDKAVVRDISGPVLDRVAAYLKVHPELTLLRVEGHTCDLGADRYNQRLSERRAKAVVDYLAQQGVVQNRLHPVGYGESRPKVPNTDEAHRELNRRVQIFVEAKK